MRVPGRAQQFGARLAATVIGRIRRSGRPAENRGLHIVHLAFEDHRRPGSGGGGNRTHEVNRRLAQRHRITVLTTRYPGARRRTEDGVIYRPIGLNLGYFGSIISYHLSIPFHVAFRRADLIVEDFAAPISSALVPLFTKKPTVAVVQWLFARESSKDYGVPFYLFEDLGVRLHDRFIVVSDYIAERIRAANPRAVVQVAYGGVSVPSALRLPAALPDRVLYLGRLQWGPKGLDLLVEAFAGLSDLPQVRLLVAGDGPSEGRFIDAAHQAGFADRIDMLGRVEGDAKWELIATATVVAIPSRYETFGLVAAEALVVGTPVVAFDLPPLREVVPDGGGILVAGYDTAAFSDALRRVVTDGACRSAMALTARAQRDRFDWDRAALAHEEVYLAAVAAANARRRSTAPVAEAMSLAGAPSLWRITEPAPARR